MADKWRRLKHLDLSRNPTLKGSLPEQIGALDSLVELHLGDCGLSGSLPQVRAQPLPLP